MSEFVKLTTLWKNQKKDGTTYLAGFLGSAKLLIFRNNKKDPENRKEPDYTVYITTNQKNYNKKQDSGDVPGDYNYEEQ